MKIPYVYRRGAVHFGDREWAFRKYSFFEILTDRTTPAIGLWKLIIKQRHQNGDNNDRSNRTLLRF